MGSAVGGGARPDSSEIEALKKFAEQAEKVGSKSSSYEVQIKSASTKKPQVYQLKKVSGFKSLLRVFQKRDPVQKELDSICKIATLSSQVLATHSSNINFSLIEQTLGTRLAKILSKISDTKLEKNADFIEKATTALENLKASRAKIEKSPKLIQSAFQTAMTHVTDPTNTKYIQAIQKLGKELAVLPPDVLKTLKEQPYFKEARDALLRAFKTRIDEERSKGKSLGAVFKAHREDFKKMNAVLEDIRDLFNDPNSPNAKWFHSTFIDSHSSFNTYL